MQQTPATVIYKSTHRPTRCVAQTLDFKSPHTLFECRNQIDVMVFSLQSKGIDPAAATGRLRSIAGHETRLVTPTSTFDFYQFNFYKPTQERQICVWSVFGFFYLRKNLKLRNRGWLHLQLAAMLAS